MSKLKHFDFSRVEHGKEKKVRLFGNGGSAFTPSHGKSKHHLNLALKNKKQESKKFGESLKKDREIYARRKLNSAEHKSFSRHENKLI